MKNCKQILSIIYLFAGLISFGQSINTFQRTYGFIGYNYGRCAYQTDDGGYIILGDVSGQSRNTDIYLVKTDTLGKIEWDKRIGDTNIYWANDFKITHDKGYIIAGYTDKVPGNGYDVLLIKTDSSGNVQWEKTYGGSDWDLGYSVIEDKQHNYVIAGETFSYSFGGGDVYLIKADSVGDTLWTKHYGGAGNDIAYSIDTTRSSNYIVSGASQRTADSTYNAYLLKVNNNGDTVWTKTFGGAFDYKLYSVHQFDDTTYIMCGTKAYCSTKNDALLVKTDTSGNITWLIYSPDTIGDNACYDTKQSWKNNYVDVGYSTSIGAGMEDVVYSIDGFVGSFGGANIDYGNSINLTKDSCYIITGTTQSFGKGISNIYFIKTGKAGGAPYPPVQEDGINEIKLGNSNFNVYPNPTSGLTNICINNSMYSSVQLEIFSDLGIALVNETFMNSGTFNIKTINLSDFTDGIYFIRVATGKEIYTFKIIKQTCR